MHFYHFFQGFAVISDRLRQMEVYNDNNFVIGEVPEDLIEAFYVYADRLKMHFSFYQTITVYCVPQGTLPFVMREEPALRQFLNVSIEVVNPCVYSRVLLRGTLRNIKKSIAHIEIILFQVWKSKTIFPNFFI